MNKKVRALFLLPLLLTTACTSLVIPDGSIPESSEGFVKSDQAREMFPQVDPSWINQLAKDNNSFALAFYEQINRGEDNIIFSPLSLSLALSMTLAGAESSTEQAMIDALKFTQPEENIYPSFNALLLAIEESQNFIPENAQGNHFQINIANSIWGQAGYPFRESFLDLLAQNYGAGMYQMDFGAKPEEAREAINSWVEKETEDKIKDLIPPNAINTLTRLVLANAIYFNGSWRYPFEKSSTADAPFTLLNGTQTTVDMMKLTSDNLGYVRVDQVQAVNLPYLSPDFAMTIIVPDEGSFSDYEAQLDAQELEGLFKSLTMNRVNLQMPKFDFPSSINANDALSALGMAEAFQIESADFTGMTENDELYITDVLQKATITVDEEGTEAAAATAVIMGLKSVMSTEPVNLIIDRPFMFFIRHLPSNSIIFMGRVTQP